MIYGKPGIVIGMGSESAMTTFADQMNKQAPRYDHRVVPMNEAINRSRRK